MNPKQPAIYLGNDNMGVARKIHDLVRILWLDRPVVAWREKELARLAGAPKALVVQIGAFDGEYHDPLSSILLKHEVAALLVEPQAESYDQLQGKYSDRKMVRIARIAIATKPGQLSLHKAVMGNGDKFGLANATANREQLKKIMNRHPIRRLLGYKIVEERVPAANLTHVLKDYKIDPEKITIFVCDTEGADGLVMQQFFKLKMKPAFVQYEHLHSSSSVVEKINQKLTALGYELRFTYTDVIAVLKR